MPSISAVIPARNRAHTIKKCLDSILRQTYKLDEIIVCDDASTDDTCTIIESYGANVRLVRHEQPQGAQAARNTAIRAATGDIIAFNDSDDIWIDEKLEKQLALMAHFQCGVVHCGALRYSERESAYSCFGTDLERFSGNAFPKLLCGLGPMFPALVTTKICLEKIGLLDEQIPAYQEWDTYLRLSRICKFSYTPLPLFIYTVGDTDAISHSLERAANGYAMIIEKHKREILGCGNHVLANHYNRLYQLYTQANMPKEAKYAMTLSVCLLRERERERERERS